jgi:uncharacterized membrane protein
MEAKGMGQSKSSHEEPSILDFDSLTDFSNNIFGFAATFLIIGISLPPITPIEAEQQLTSELLALWPRVVSYVISFISINSYWRLHSFILMHIHRVDNGLALLNTLLLLSVTFLPFPTSLMGYYGRLPVIAFIYGVALSFNYLFLYLIATYAQRRHLLKSELRPQGKRFIKLKLLVPLVSAVLGTLLSLFFTQLSFLFYFLVILTHLIPIHPPPEAED